MSQDKAVCGNFFAMMSWAGVKDATSPQYISVLFALRPILAEDAGAWTMAFCMC